MHFDTEPAGNNNTIAITPAEEGVESIGARACCPDNRYSSRLADLCSLVGVVFGALGRTPCPDNAPSLSSSTSTTTNRSVSTLSSMAQQTPKPRASLMSLEAAIAVPDKHELAPEGDEPADSEEKEPPGTIMGAYVTMCLTCLGNKLMLTPGIMATTGFVAGFCVFLLPAVLSAFTLRMLVRLAEASSQGDYANVIMEFLGEWGRRLSFWSLVCVLSLVSTGCLAFPVEVIPQMVPNVSPWMAGAGSVALAMPLALAKTLSHLRYASTFALAALAYTAAVVVARALSKGEVRDSVTPFAPPSMLGVSVAQGLSAFGAELSTIQCYVETSPRYRRRFTRRVIDASMITVLLLYFVVGCFGYVVFGADAESNLLINMQGDVWSMAAQSAVVFGNLLRAPILSILLFVTVTSQFDSVSKRCKESCLARATFQGGAIAGAGALAATMGKVGVVQALMGGTSGVALFQVLPSAAWLVARRAGRVQRSAAVDVAAICMLVGSPLFSIYFGYIAISQWDQM